MNKNPPSERTAKEDTRRMFNMAATLLFLSIILFLCQLLNLRTTQAKASSPDRLPISIRAISQADYSADPYSTVPPVRIEILNQLVFDIPGTGIPMERIATLKAALLSPVATMTSSYHLPATFTPAPATFTPLSSTSTMLVPHMTFVIPTSYLPLTATAPYSYPTLSPALSTSTRSPRPTKLATKTRTATATGSPTQTLLPTATRTGTATVTATQTSTSTGTATSSPTNTFTATATSTHTATATATDTGTATSTATNTATASLTATLSTGCVADPTGALSAVQDTWVDRTSATTSYGSDGTLNIRPTGSVDQRALVAFDLSGIPAGSTVLSADLFITVTNGGNYAVEFYPINQLWDESVTWNTQPTYDATSGGSFTLTATACTRVSSLSAALVQSWIDNPATNYGIYLYPPSGAGQATFSSREGASAPKLIVNYAP